MCLAQGPQCSDAYEARTRGPSVSSQALYHWATALPSLVNDQFIYPRAFWLQFVLLYCAITLTCLFYNSTRKKRKPSFTQLIIRNDLRNRFWQRQIMFTRKLTLKYRHIIQMIQRACLLQINLAKHCFFYFIRHVRLCLNQRVVKLQKNNAT